MKHVYVSITIIKEDKRIKRIIKENSIRATVIAASEGFTSTIKTAAVQNNQALLAPRQV